MSTGFMGKNERTLTDFFSTIHRIHELGNVTQSQGMPNCMDFNGMASVRTMVNMARSRKSGCTGANPKPQLPITTLVTPCQPDSEQYNYKQLRVVVGVQIDEPGRNDEAVGVEYIVALLARDAPDLGDDTIFDADVGAVTPAAGAIDNHAPRTTTSNCRRDHRCWCWLRHYRPCLEATRNLGKSASTGALGLSRFRKASDEQM